MKNIIIGKNSSISKHVYKKLKNSYLFSANNLNGIYLLNKIKNFKKINLIFNNFYPSKNLNKLNHKNYKIFCELSLEKISLIFHTIPSYKIKKFKK